MLLLRLSPIKWKYVQHLLFEKKRLSSIAVRIFPKTKIPGNFRESKDCVFVLFTLFLAKTIFHSINSSINLCVCVCAYDNFKSICIYNNAFAVIAFSHRISQLARCNSNQENHPKYPNNKKHTEWRIEILDRRLKRKWDMWNVKCEYVLSSSNKTGMDFHI